MSFTKILAFVAVASLYVNAGLAQHGNRIDATVAEQLDGDKERKELELKIGTKKVNNPVRRWYSSDGFDGAIFSSSFLESPTRSDRKLSTLRFSLINFGWHFNYNFNENLGIFTGIGIKNIGFIEKIQDSTIKRRVYAVGVPLAIKFGNVRENQFGFVGGGLDFPFNYREKGFIKRGNKEKFNEWFSERTDVVMPYVFAGISFLHGTTLKVQYYPTNFLNTKFEEKTGTLLTRPYKDYNVNLIYVTLGLEFGYNKMQQKPKKVSPEPASTLM